MVYKPEAPKKVWIYRAKCGGWSWSAIRVRKDDIEYVPADTFAACLEAGRSLNRRLFELTEMLLDNPEATGREIADALDDAGLALDKWNRFLDSKEE